MKPRKSSVRFQTESSITSDSGAADIAECLDCDAKIMCTLHEIPPLSVEDKPNLYLTMDDYERIYCESFKTVRRWKRHTNWMVFKFDKVGNTIRGLEDMVDEKKARVRCTHQGYVLREQAFQKKRGLVPNPEKFREKSLITSKKSQDIAIAQARKDYEALSEFCSQETSRDAGSEGNIDDGEPKTSKAEKKPLPWLDKILLGNSRKKTLKSSIIINPPIAVTQDSTTLNMKRLSEPRDQ